MRIIAVNKFHYFEGGPERYLFGLTEYLESQGHEVIPFAMGYARNFPSPYSGYFLKPAGGGTDSKLGQLEGGAMTKLRIAGRSIYSHEAKAALGKLIDDTKPDIVYCLNIVNHMSPSVIDAARSRGIPVVMRVSDYNLVCPSYLLLRDGQVCTECQGGYYRAVKHKCVYGSTVATMCRVIGMYVHRLIRVYDKVHAFVIPALSMRDIMVKGGFPAEKIHHIPTFINSARWEPRYDNDGYILYLGRISPEKGIEVLLAAHDASGIDVPLVVIGDGPEEYKERLIAQSSGKSVQFVGHKSGQELQDLVRGANFVVVPSVCNDNSPNVIYESFAAGKPVIGSALGGITEQITPETGILVEPGSADELAKAMLRLTNYPELVEEMGRKARNKVETENSIETHVSRLLSLFESAIAG